MILDMATAGQVLAAARRRAGMSVAEVAETIGLDTAQLAAAEDGGAVPLDVLARAVAATGARLVVGLADARAAAWDAPEQRDLEAAVTNLLVRTTPQGSYPLDLRRTWHYAAVGLHLLARAQLQAAAALHALGHLRSVGPVLARTIFEHVATVLWIAEAPEERAETFVQHSNLQLERLAGEAAGWEEALVDARRRWSAAYGERAFTAKLPPFQQRLVGPMGEWYPRYRDLSSHTHPTALAVDAMLAVSPDAVEVRVDGPDARLLAFSAVMVWTLALQLETGFGRSDGGRTGLGFDGDVASFVALGAALNRFTVSEPPTAGDVEQQDRPATAG